MTMISLRYETHRAHFGLLGRHPSARESNLLWPPMPTAKTAERAIRRSDQDSRLQDGGVDGHVDGGASDVGNDVPSLDGRVDSGADGGTLADGLTVSRIAVLQYAQLPIVEAGIWNAAPGGPIISGARRTTACVRHGRCWMGRTEYSRGAHDTKW